MHSAHELTVLRPGGAFTYQEQDEAARDERHSEHDVERDRESLLLLEYLIVHHVLSGLRQRVIRRRDRVRVAANVSQYRVADDGDGHAGRVERLIVEVRRNISATSAVNRLELGRYDVMKVVRRQTSLSLRHEKLLHLTMIRVVRYVFERLVGSLEKPTIHLG